MSTGHATLRWSGGIDGHLVLLDQTRLPTKIVEVDCHTVEDVWQSIKRLAVRGAPAIGCAAAYGVCLSLPHSRAATQPTVPQPTANSPTRTKQFDMRRASRCDAAVEKVQQACNYLATSRPTAVNLFWALDRMRSVAERAAASSPAARAPAAMAERLLAEARLIHEEDRRQCAAIGQHGAELLTHLFDKKGDHSDKAGVPKRAGILTHCNAGALATGGDGTALAVIFALAEQGKRPQVFADETRPLLQGARLTMWELLQRNIDATLLCDSMAAQVMREGRVQAVITGADRIAASGDAANKIGTYGLAVLARAHDIPFYIAAPTTTFDLLIPSGDDIPIEERPAEEITHGFGRVTAPAGARVYNPAFDVTPAPLITAIVTEQGVIQPVTVERVKGVVGG